YNGSTQVFSDTFNTLRSGPTFHSFNSSNITSFTFRAGNGNQVVIDNLTLNAGAVPETATWGMMIAGFGLMGASMRYRRRSAKVTFA
ncbi:MAG: PEPxxWA-CTERM sorting domain-containing protein, partial [Pseudomonadota bacterium]|nr:PEPxxWA-CTERM sorting domain-containing protein [Pseudomonadota bacterium]